MTLLIELSEIGPDERAGCGGKAAALSRLIQGGFTVPPGMCVTTDAYRRYVDDAGLRERILLEVNRKRSGEMRWEEMWDTALRIRNLFHTTQMPGSMAEELAPRIEERFGDRPVVVRSSATTEDSRKTSYAGLHESFVNIRGVESILKHIRLVWASLWSDGALLYREELGLDMDSDAMAVVIQELVAGASSGVAFCVDPTDPVRGVIEAVHGLNKGLVDGDVEPDRWFIRRDDGRVLAHESPVRDRAVAVKEDGLVILTLGSLGERPPLTDGEVDQVWNLTRRAEERFGSPQDLEWTLHGGQLYTLQSRPITTGVPDPSERGSRAWALGLKVSFDRLARLRDRIENLHFPAMAREADSLAGIETGKMTDDQLAGEIRRRVKILGHWTDIYWEEFIPMAHGARLFGQVFNDVMAPEDPYLFVELLRDTPMITVTRNRDLEELAAEVRRDPGLARCLEAGTVPDDHMAFQDRLDSFLADYGDQTWSGTRLSANRESLLKFILNLASAPARLPGSSTEPPDVSGLAEDFVGRFPPGRQAEAEDLLDLARASWHLRDDDNVYLGRIEGQVQAASEEGIRRLAERGVVFNQPPPPETVAAVLTDPHRISEKGTEGPAKGAGDRVRPRQLVGQPACGGIARGRARVVTGFADLPAFRSGEILVCDAVDPNMTLLVPLAAAIVERRGGMLIHGAIIAREYGIPCVNGVPEATGLIRTGSDVTVDGYLGLVVVHGENRSGKEKGERGKARSNSK